MDGRTLATIVRARRKSLGLTIATAATRLDVTPQTYLRWEDPAKAGEMKLSTLHRLCRALNMRIVVEP